MDNMLKSTWIEKLEGDEYVQGQDELCLLAHDEEGDEQLTHCCLGVLAEILEIPRDEYLAYEFPVPPEVVERIKNELIENGEVWDSIEGLTDSSDAQYALLADGTYVARATTMIPDFLADQLGLTKKFPTTDHHGEPTHDELRNILAKMNDSGSKSFKDIAEHLKSIDF